MWWMDNSVSEDRAASIFRVEVCDDWMVEAGCEEGYG
jgi:hypothetical protein